MRLDRVLLEVKATSADQIKLSKIKQDNTLKIKGTRNVADENGNIAAAYGPSVKNFVDKTFNDPNGPHEIEITDNLSNKYVPANATLNAKCAKHNENKIKVSVNKINDVANRRFLNKNGIKTSGEINICKDHSNEEKYGKLKQKKPGVSKQEGFAYEYVKNIINSGTYSFLKGCKLYPEGNINGKKRVWTVKADGKNTNVDIDIEITLYNGEPKKEVSKNSNTINIESAKENNNNGVSKFLGFNRIGIAVDGIHHQYGYEQSKFERDFSRIINGSQLIRINIFGTEERESEDKQNVEDTIKKIFENNEKLYIQNLRNTTDKAATKEQRSLSSEKNVERAANKSNKDANTRTMLNRLLVDLYTNSHIRGNKEGVDYVNKNGEKETLYNFLEKNPKSYFYDSESWNELSGNASKETLKAWKEKHQAKNGEKLYSRDREGNTKLFENKNNPAK